MSPELQQFLREWLNWAEAGVPDHDVFLPNYGLCTNSDHWGVTHHCHIRDELQNALADEFNGDDCYPFGGGPYLYERESIDETHHLNPTRLAWVRGKLGVAL